MCVCLSCDLKYELKYHALYLFLIHFLLFSFHLPLKKNKQTAISLHWKQAPLYVYTQRILLYRGCGRSTGCRLLKWSWMGFVLFFMFGCQVSEGKARHESRTRMRLCLCLAELSQFILFSSFCFPLCNGRDSDSPDCWSPCQLWCECRRAPALWVSLLKEEPTHASPCPASSPYKCVKDHLKFPCTKYRICTL